VLIVSCYTPSYAAVVQPLQQSLKDLGLSAHLETVCDRGSWLANTWIKPRFLLDVLDGLTYLQGESICWVDADARVLKPPKPLEDLAGVDLALVVEYKPHRDCFYYNARAKQVEACVTRREPPLCRGGTLMLANNRRVRRFLRLWLSQEAGCLRRGTPEQEPIGWAATKAGLNVARLPLEYCAIFDSDHVADPVIVHYQASREMRERQEAKGKRQKE